MTSPDPMDLNAPENRRMDALVLALARRLRQEQGANRVSRDRLLQEAQECLPVAPGKRLSGLLNRIVARQMVDVSIDRLRRRGELEIDHQLLRPTF